MNAIRSIRLRLDITQAALAQALGVTQGNVHHYERGQTMPPDKAKKLIEFGASLGHVISFDEIYAADATLAVPAATLGRRATDRVDAAPPLPHQPGEERRHEPDRRADARAAADLSTEAIAAAITANAPAIAEALAPAVSGAIAPAIVADAPALAAALKPALAKKKTEG